MNKTCTSDVYGFVFSLPELCQIIIIGLILSVAEFSALALTGDTFQATIGIWKSWFNFWGEEKTGVPGEEPLGAEKRRQSTTHSIHTWRRVRQLNPRHIGGRRALSTLRHPCSPMYNLFPCKIWDVIEGSLKRGKARKAAKLLNKSLFFKLALLIP